MARRRRTGQRVANDPTQPKALSNSLVDVEDNRLFTPEAPFAEPRLLSGNQARVGVEGQFPLRDLATRTRELMEYPENAVRQVPKDIRRSVRRGLSPRGRRDLDAAVAAFQFPKKVVHCIRRKLRRKVMFAFELRRKGSGAKRRRRNEFSDIKC